MLKLTLPSLIRGMNFRQLILRANRFLGSSLVDKDLVQEGTLELANERLLEMFNEKPVSRPMLLEILIYEMQTLAEADYLDVLARGSPIGLIDLSRVAVHTPEGVTAEECRATNTVVFDTMEQYHFLATTYYLSTPIREYWQERFSGSVQWFACSIASMNEQLESMQSDPPAVAAT